MDLLTRTLKSLVKSLDSLLGSDPPAKELSAEFEETAQNYIEHHSPIESHESSKLQDELVHFFKHYHLDGPQPSAKKSSTNQSSNHSNTASPAPSPISGAGVSAMANHENTTAGGKTHHDLNRQVVFLNALTQLCPCIINEDHVKHWYNLYGPIAIDSAGQKNAVVKACRDFLLAVLTCGIDSSNNASGGDSKIEEVYSSNSHMLANWILDWHLRNHIRLENDPSKDASLSSITPNDSDVLKDNLIAKLEERQRFARANAKTILFRYGAKRPKEFFSLLSARFAERKFRTETLTLLSAYVVSQPPSLFQIQYTPLLGQIYQCLERDMSSTVLSICATVLAMILPHICDILIPELPRLYGIYGRLASWQYIEAEDEEIEPASLQESKSMGSEKNETKSDPLPTWEVMNHLYEINDQRVPVICPLFTFLYGLFPSNTLEFLRQPTEYLRAAEQPLPDLWDKGVIQSQSRAIMGLHTLSPELLVLSAKEEIEDSGRWHHMGSSTDIASKCLSLYNYTSSSVDAAVTTDTNLTDFSVLLQDLDLNRDVYESTTPPEESKDILSSPGQLSIDRMLLDHEQLYNRKKTNEHDDASAAEPVSATSQTAEGSTNLAPVQSQDLVNRSPIFGNASSMTGSVTSLNALQQLASPRLEPSLARTQQLKLVTPSNTGAQPDQSAVIEQLNMTIEFYQRELMLLKNELDFVAFIEQHSQYRFKKLKEQLSETAMAQAKVEELQEHNRILRAKLTSPDQDQVKFQNSFRTYKSERRAYEGMLVAKNKEFRSQIAQFKHELEESKTRENDLESAKKMLEEAALQKETLISRLELRISDAERQIRRMVGYEKTVKELRQQLSQLKPRINGQALSQATIDKDKAQKQQCLELEQEVKFLRAENEKMERDFETRAGQLESCIRQLSERVENNNLNGANQFESEGQSNNKQAMEDFKNSVESRYERLEAAFNQLSEKYHDLLKRVRDQTVSDEERRARIDQPVLPKRSLLGYDIIASNGTDDEDNNGSSSHLNTKAENRVRGRGGVQNLGRHAK